ncbi:MAG TPA: hypothetical protein DHV55_13945 [Clostridiaceae bacterium]|nr:hypothetical protein [Clostridiaceae bacterium]
MLKEIGRETKDFVIELLGVICPPIAAAESAKEYLANISNIILVDKIRRFIVNQDSDFEQWLKLACNFENDSAKYKNTIKMLIYTIDSINDDMKIDIYANLMKAYKNSRLMKDVFLRLASILPIIFYDDLVFLTCCKNN